jgi:hypothetical protein
MFNPPSPLLSLVPIPYSQWYPFSSQIIPLPLSGPDFWKPRFRIWEKACDACLISVAIRVLSKVIADACVFKSFPLVVSKFYVLSSVDMFLGLLFCSIVLGFCFCSTAMLFCYYGSLKKYEIRCCDCSSLGLLCAPHEF